MVTDDNQEAPDFPIDEFYKVEADRPEINKRPIISAAIWMSALSIMLGWIPFIGSFVAGYEGGKKAGSLSGALIAVIVPILLMTILIKGAFSIFYFREEINPSLIILVFNILLFFGALFGGLKNYGKNEKAA